MAISLADIRARLQASSEGNKKGGNTNNDHLTYPFWDMDEGKDSTLRFLPDGDSKNSFFWIERALIKLPFNGILNDPEYANKQVFVQVPCVEMWGENCPILAEVRNWFKDDSLAELGRKYWKKRSYIFQGFVRENGMADDVTPENPIRRFIISPSLFQIIKAALMDPELEELPTDYNRGLDFRITKTAKGGFADYSTSKWARKETSLTDAERQAVETHGLFNLADWLPKKPTEADLAVMVEMFEASVEGKPFDNERWGSHFRVPGYKLPNQANRSQNDGSSLPQHRPVMPAVSTSTVAAPVNTAATVANVANVANKTASDFDDDIVNDTAQEAPKAVNPQNAQDILAMIRNRNKA